MMLRRLHRSFALGSAVVAAGCAGSGALKVTKLAATAGEPANVAVYLRVEDAQGRSIPGLAEKNFRVYEDGKLVTTGKGRRALLEPTTFERRYLLLLVDLSGPIADSEDFPGLIDAVGAFMDRLGATHEIAVGAFDGNDAVVPFLGYAGTAGTKKVMEAMRKFRPRSRNGNLNGAVYQGLHSLRDRLNEAGGPQRSASLVVFTDRGELAHSVSPETLRQGLGDTAAEVWVIGAGEKLHRQELTALARGGTFLSNDPKAYREGFKQIAERLAAGADGRYVFSYCSPKRKGDHKVEVEAVTTSARGRLMFKFNADGFTGGCSPRARPDLAPASGKPRELTAQRERGDDGR